ncbi:MAG: AbrB/MazE/SpoVT family DNA-binding domain-containing protein [Candidatus Lokiarchaeota archaeon]|nr:AbrB/MazE/SpoVT family DNA-binding domain-containing protein [Candidatus Lokiarchaeota archaeon]
MSSKPGSCGCTTAPNEGKNSLFAVTKIDDRGQIVIPKEIRDSLGWNKNERIAMLTRKNAEGKACCVMLVHVDSFEDSIKEFVGKLK